MSRRRIGIGGAIIGVLAIVAGVLLGLHQVRTTWSVVLIRNEATFGPASCGTPFSPAHTSLVSFGLHGSEPYQVVERDQAIVAACDHARLPALAGALSLLAGGALLAVVGVVLVSLRPTGASASPHGP